MKNFALFLATIGLTAAANAQWTGTVIHPGGTFSAAYGAGSGIALGNSGTNLSRAGYWTNQGTTFTELHQNTFTSSITFAGDLNMQVGSVSNPGSGHAARWFGTAASFEDMNPSRFTYSTANCMVGTRMAGSAQGGPIPGARALLWNGGGAEDYVDLTPTGYSSAGVNGMDASSQVGGATFDADGYYHALLWSGASDSYVDLNPADVLGSNANAVFGGWQGGRAQSLGGQDHAYIWNGTAASAIDLHPDSQLVSGVYGMSANYQVGTTYFESDHFYGHAGLWMSSKQSWVDLHSFLPDGFKNSAATSIVEYADRIEIYGYAQREYLGDDRLAVMWSQPVPEPASMVALSLGALGLLRSRRKNRQ